MPIDSKLKIAMLRLGPTLNLELMEYESPGQRQVMPKNSDFDAPHIALFVSDMDAAADYLKEHGCELFSGPLLSNEGPKAGQFIRYFQSPWGMYLEILSRPQHMPYERQSTSHLFGPVTIIGDQPKLKPARVTSEARKQQMLKIGRVLVTFPFLMNALGVLPQQETAAALVRAGFSQESVSFLVHAGRAVQLVGGLALASGKFSRAASAALMTFLISATIIGHPFWKASDQKSRTQDEASTFVNVGLLGALFYLAIAEWNADEHRAEVIHY